MHHTTPRVCYFHNQTMGSYHFHVFQPPCEDPVAGADEAEVRILIYLSILKEIPQRRFPAKYMNILRLATKLVPLQAAVNWSLARLLLRGNIDNSSAGQLSII